MPLRKSPTRTRALLAANRRNSRKSTGPRTELGKSHSAGNAVRHYRRTRPSSCIPIENDKLRAFEDFLSKLREAIIPADNAAGTETVLLKAAEVWRVKRSFDRWIETRTEEDWLVLAGGGVPRPRTWRLTLRRPGVSAPDWIVTASVSLRHSRRPTRGPGQSLELSRRSATKDKERPDRTGIRTGMHTPRMHAPRMHAPRMHAPRMHVTVSVHSTGPREVARASRPSASRPELALSKAQGWPCHEPEESAEPDSERTKPESFRNQAACKNMSSASGWGEIEYRDNAGNSTYNSLQATFEKPISHGLTFQAAYTYSHLIDYEQDDLYGGVSPYLVEDRYNIRGTARGNSDMDNRHRLAVGYVYHIPRVGASTTGAAHALCEITRDWRVSGMTTYRTGGPFTVLADQIDSLVEGPYSG